MILVTGAAGFIGYHTCHSLLSTNQKVLGIDSLNNYYDLNLKKKRLKNLKKKFKNKFKFIKLNIENFEKLKKELKKNNIKKIIHLAAQAGVRYSNINPSVYYNSNLKGFFNILECCRLLKINKLIFSSSSSVYGDSNLKFIKEISTTNRPLSFYAATKCCNENMAFSYSNIFKIKVICVRLFTVYGPYGRPDMVPFKFTKLILENRKIKLNNNGNHKRDFTYVSDVTNILVRLLKKKQINFYDDFNISAGTSMSLKKFIIILRKILKKKIKIQYCKKQNGDVLNTHGNNLKIKNFISYKKFINVNTGMRLFVAWYKSFYKL